MQRLVVSSSPHVRSSLTTQRVMLDVIIALLPAFIAGTVIFGVRSLAVVLTCVGSAVLSELLFNLAVKKEQTVGDLSAVVTGLILGLSLRADSPIWMCVIGSVFAIVVVKCLFGGLGCNFANPAVTGRVVLLIAYASALGGGSTPKIDGFTSSAALTSSATPLEAYGTGGAVPSMIDLLFGINSGAIGETCVIAIVIGFLYLVIRKIINPEIPLIFVGTVFLFSLVFTGSFTDALFQILTGGLMFGAVFMATDYVTTPITRSGKMIFALGCGLITVLVRFFGSYPEGVSFAILFMNILSPYIEKWTAKIPLGGKAK